MRELREGALQSCQKAAFFAAGAFPSDMARHARCFCLPF
jgi:hypothetical protein